MIKIGVLGAGHLGKIHLRLLNNIPAFQLVGFYDQNPEVSRAVAQEYELQAFESAEELVAAVDAVDIVTPTNSHFELAQLALRNTVHVFIEKPIAATVEEARSLTKLAHEAGVVNQVGHVERFNPAFLTVRHRQLQPMFIETHRLAQWNPRGTDVSVVLDLMIHDLDIVLHLINSSVKKVSASGVAVVTDTPDIANARIEFHNGAVANLTASRISMKNMRKMRLFQHAQYLSLDFLDKKVEAFSIMDEEPEGRGSMSFEAAKHTKYLVPEMPEVTPVNAIEEELKEFALAIQQEQSPAVPFHDATLALQTAFQIAEKIQPLGA